MESVGLSVSTKLKPTAIYVDVNSVSHPTIEQIADAIESGGARFVDAAIMGPVPLLKLEVPINLAGNAAEDFHHYAKTLGFNTKILSSLAGDASTLKMLWSVMT